MHQDGHYIDLDHPHATLLLWRRYFDIPSIRIYQYGCNWIRDRQPVRNQLPNLAQYECICLWCIDFVFKLNKYKNNKPEFDRYFSNSWITRFLLKLLEQLKCTRLIYGWNLGFLPKRCHISSIIWPAEYDIHDYLNCCRSIFFFRIRFKVNRNFYSKLMWTNILFDYLRLLVCYRLIWLNYNLNEQDLGCRSIYSYLLG